MGSFLEDLGLEVLEEALGEDKANAFLINRLVKRGRTRPHPWTTKNDYISWTGLTDRTFSARLLPAKPYPPVEALGTRRPPIAEVARLFETNGGQREDLKSTLLFPAFAQYLTDGFIRTRLSNVEAEVDRKRTTTNHEIDMSPLYGRIPEQTAVLRVKNPPAGKKGQLKTDTSAQGHIIPPLLYDGAGKPKPEFCDAKGKLILDEPLGISRANNKASLYAVGGDRANATPQVSMINLLFLREHNRLAAALEAANPLWDDDRVFETARNIIIVMFIKIVVEEYINHINTSKFRFLADPKVAWEAEWNRPNWMTAEFSLLYRWHSLVPEKLKWGGQDFPGEKLLLDNSMLSRDGLATAFAEVSANGGTQLGLGNTAKFLVPFEQRAVLQARENQIATYNDYRRAMKMDPAEDFRDITGKKSKSAAEEARREALAKELQRLYGQVDNVEFYVGLFAEPGNRNGPLPELILAMVAMDAFSQALTNPLLSQHVWGNEDNQKLAFTKIGLDAIKQTKTLRDILSRNSTGPGNRFVGMTRPGWKRD